MKLMLSGGRVIDPDSGLDEVKDLLIEDGFIRDLADPGSATGFGEQAEVIDVTGLWVAPGLIDMHVHTREPGEEYKETVATASASAAAGGFTAAAAMPNTKPVNDNRSVTEFILAQAKAAGLARVYPVAAMTMGQLGENLCEYGELAEVGAVGVSDDGRWVENAAVMRRVLEYSQAFGLTPITHAEDPALSGAGVMNEGPTATRLGLTGLPAAAEETAIFRDVNLAALTGAPLHIAHVSTAGGVEIIRQAKKRGLPVTAETAPHYFTLTETAVEGYRTEAKMKPPLRSDADRAAIRAGLAEGVIDVIATDHAPHSTLEKDTLFEEAAFGVVGLETAVPLALELVRLRVLTPWQMIAALSVNPARILGVEGGALRPGRPADVVVIDPRMEWVVNPAAFQSKSRNTPFAGLTVTGRAVLTILQGKPTYRSIR